MQKFIKNHVFSLIAWLLILVISIVALPNVNQLTRDHAEIKLPADTQTTIAIMNGVIKLRIHMRLR